MGQCYSTTSVIMRKASEKLENAAAYIASESNRRYVPVPQEEISNVINDEKEIEEIFNKVSDEDI